MIQSSHPNAATPHRRARHRRTSRVRRTTDTHAAVLAAAMNEFSERGYEGARVDRIAATAGVNKAMLYYHFGSKQGLYQAVVRDMVGTIAERARAIAGLRGTAQQRLDGWIAAVVEEAAARPWFPPIMLRELASGARHLDAETFGLLNGVFGAVREVIVDGQTRGEFRKSDPLLTYLTIMPPILLFFARERVRARSRVMRGLTAPRSRQQFVQHMQASVRGMLRKDS
jgi:AcrR family transcriptional regulator